MSDTSKKLDENQQHNYWSELFKGALSGAITMATMQYICSGEHTPNEALFTVPGAIEGMSDSPQLNAAINGAIMGGIVSTVAGISFYRNIIEAVEHYLDGYLPVAVIEPTGDFAINMMGSMLFWINLGKIEHTVSVLPASMIYSLGYATCDYLLGYVGELGYDLLYS
jgi:hypothetical protein